jgi:hypothetical protein
MKNHYFILIIATCFVLCVFCIVGCQQAPTSSDGSSTHTLTLNPFTDASNGPPYQPTGEALRVQGGGYTSYLWFDLSSINTLEHSLVSATLRITQSALTNAGTTHIKICTATWDAYNVAINSILPTLGTEITSKNFNSLTTWDIDITSGVQLWFNGTTNYGLGFVGDSPTDFSFYSMESLNKPKLTVVYK